MYVLWIPRCQIVVRFLAFANSKKERFKQLCNELCRFQSPIPISIGSNFNNQPNGQQKQGPCKENSENIQL
jgi:hypothetical protein